MERFRQNGDVTWRTRRHVKDPFKVSSPQVMHMHCCLGICEVQNRMGFVSLSRIVMFMGRKTFTSPLGGNVEASFHLELLPNYLNL
jgi:hypothetical protein